MTETRIGAGFLGAISSVNGVDQLRRAAGICQDGGLSSFWVADQRWQRDVSRESHRHCGSHGLVVVGNTSDRPVHQASGAHCGCHRDP